MINHQLSVSYTEYDRSEELNEADRLLLDEAWKACEKAYAPYSKFHVGAALQLQNQAIFTGNNQENAAYPSGLCAERVAMFSASAAQPDSAIHTIAVVAKTDAFNLSEPVTPCGSCRQVMSEYEMLSGKPIRVIMQGNSEKVWVVEGVSNLLPMMFHGTGLKKKNK